MYFIYYKRGKKLIILFSSYFKYLDTYLSVAIEEVVLIVLHTELVVNDKPLRFEHL